MEAVGIICEFNPLHNGHIYFINKVKEKNSDKAIVLVLTGYITERGEISLISKYDKAKLALKFGVDVVIDMPLVYTLQSADVFAKYAVTLLYKLGVNNIYFGSELADKEKLLDIAKKINNMDLKNVLKQNKSYAKAIYDEININISSNDILGVSYIKAIINNNFNMEFNVIKRINDYNDIESNKKIVSANNIREKLSKGEDIKKYIPEYDINLINSIDYKKMFELIKYRVLTDKYIGDIFDMNEELKNRITNCIYDVNSFDELVNKVKSKRYSAFRIQRLFMHILFGIYKDDVKDIDYVRVIGFSDKGKVYLKDKDALFAHNGKVEKIEQSACYIYESLTGNKVINEEKSNKPVMIKE